jgi:creatinine amidohydrolase
MVYPLPTATASDASVLSATAAVLPVGSYEQHGPFLPLATDALIAGVVSDDLAHTYGLLPLPPITISCSHEHAKWKGTVSIKASTLYAMVTDIHASLVASGIPKLLIVNGHGGNYVLSHVVQEASVAGPNLAIFPTSDDWAAARIGAGLELQDGYADMHAGELETSILLHALPDVLRPGYETADHEVTERPTHLLSHGISAYSDSGVIGRPSAASAQKGKAALAILRARAAAHLEAIGVPSTAHS